MSNVSTGTPQLSAAPRHVPLEQRSLLQYFNIGDKFALFAWVLTTSFPNEMLARAKYLVIAYFVVGAILHARQTVPTLFRAWPAFILPIMALVSMLWAPSANEAIRRALLVSLAAFVAIYAASRVSSRQILICYFAGELIGAVLSLVTPNPAGGGWTGIFGQKNFLAMHMFIMYTAGLVLVLDAKTSLWLRGVALGGVLLGAFLVFMAKSGTTTILMLGATTALVAHALMWQPAAKVRHMRTLIMFAVTLVTIALALILFGLFQFDAMASVLEALGKDSTLTGRTFIWDIGHRVMEEHPLTGVGANGFWRPELGAAREITRFFHYDGFTKFSFHNSYIENGVQFGYPGYYATYFLAGWGLLSVAVIWLRNQTLMNAAFLTLTVMVLIRSNAEIDLASELGATMVLLYIGALRGKHPEDQEAAERPRRARHHPVRFRWRAR